MVKRNIPVLVVFRSTFELEIYLHLVYFTKMQSIIPPPPPNHLTFPIKRLYILPLMKEGHARYYIAHVGMPIGLSQRLQTWYIDARFKMTNIIMQMIPIIPYCSAGQCQCHFELCFRRRIHVSETYLDLLSSIILPSILHSVLNSYSIFSRKGQLQAKHVYYICQKMLLKLTRTR